MINNYFWLLLRSFERHKLFMSLYAVAFIFSMMVIAIASSVFTVILNPDCLKDNGRNVYHISQGKGRNYRGDFNKKSILKLKNLPEDVDVGRYYNRFETRIVKGVDIFEFNYVYIDSIFCNHLDLNFVDGENLNRIHFRNRAKVAIVSDRLVERLELKNPIGEYLICANRRFQIVGVFKRASSFKEFVADCYIADTSLPDFKSPFFSIYIFSSDAELISTAEQRLNNQNDKNEYRFESLYEKRYDNSLQETIKITVVIILLMLLPVLFLVNLVTHRMELRWGELGIMRAFGATRRSLYVHLLIENLLLTLACGIVALCLSHYILSIILYGYVRSLFDFALPLNGTVMVISLFMLFGILTAMIPARRVSRRTIVASLNEG